VWHYQTTPGDTWDFTAVQPMMLADLQIGGRQRKVIMQAPKNGFFYVLDRGTGELLSADKYVEVNWASHVDMKTGRPVEVPGADYKDKGTYIRPGPLGGHNWQAMSFSPRTGLVYIPAQDNGRYFEASKTFSITPLEYNLGLEPIGRNLIGAQVLILGGGGICRCLIELLEPFGCDITVFRHRNEQVANAIDQVANAMVLVQWSQYHLAVAGGSYIRLASIKRVSHPLPRGGTDFMQKGKL